MKENKILIYFNEYHLKATGGPAGYLYNLKKGLERKKNTEICFIEGEDKNKSKKELLHKLPRAFQKFYYFIARCKERNELISSKKQTTTVDLNNYKIVHFHSTHSLYKCKDSLEDYKGKVILTSHSPKAYFLEKYEDAGLFKLEKHLLKKFYFEKMSLIDEYAFNHADIILFPCKEAEECYYNTWSKYSEIHKKNNFKYRYLPTGIDEVKIFESREKVREYYNIPQNAFVISYVGRHNETKGYRKLKEIGKNILNNYNNVYFLIGGKEAPIKGINNERWIEVGWTDKPHDLINASDLFILPNKETFFDLIFLEVLSLGKTMLVTNTGGNKYFKKFEDTGIYFYDYDNVNEAVMQIENIRKINLKLSDIKNKELYNKYFTTEIFTQNYINLYKAIEEEK